jgi:hypothetical protein
MPPIQTQSKKLRGILALPEFGFAPVGRLKAHEHATAVAQRETKSTAETPAHATSGADEAHRAPEALETHKARELEEICEFSAAPAGLAVIV